MNRKSSAYVFLMAGVCFALLGASVPSIAQDGPTATPSTGDIGAVTTNAQWTPRLEMVEGAEMALVPPGCFSMGSESADDEKPVSQQCFEKPFWIDKTEVTQAQFKQFDGKASASPKFIGDNHPVDKITWLEAKAYCDLRGARLPTEAEWEFAARGPDGLIYPWGNDFKPANVVFDDNSNGKTADVGSKPSGASWVGALDMSGNVLEWVSSQYKPYPYKSDDGREANTKLRTDVLFVMRGGSLYGNDDSLRAAYRHWDVPNFGDSEVGFRCAHDFTESTVAATPSPSDGAKAFLDAVFSGNAFESYVCKASQAEATQLKLGLASMKTQLEATGAKLDTTGLTYETSNQSGDTADVRVSGSLKVTVGGQSVDSPFPGVTFKMKNEDGWKYCGSSQ